MATKINLSGASEVFVIHDSSVSEVYAKRYPAARIFCEVRPGNRIYIKLVNDQSEGDLIGDTNGYVFGDLVKPDDSPFTSLSEVVDWFDDNTGKSKGSGTSGSGVSAAQLTASQDAQDASNDTKYKSSTPSIFERAIQGDTINIVSTSDSRQDAYYTRYNEYASKQWAKINVAWVDDNLSGQTTAGWLSNTSFNGQSTLNNAVANIPNTGLDTVWIWSMGYNDPDGTVQEYETLWASAIDALLAQKPDVTLVFATPIFASGDEVNGGIMRTAMGNLATTYGAEFVDSYPFMQSAYELGVTYWNTVHQDYYGSIIDVDFTMQQLVPSVLFPFITLPKIQPYKTELTKKNLALDYPVTNGYWNAAAAGGNENTDKRKLPLIPVEENSILQIRHLGNTKTVHFENEDNEYVGNGNLLERDLSGYREITVPIGAKYVAVNIEGADVAGYDALNDVPIVQYKQNVVSKTHEELNAGINITLPYSTEYDSEPTPILSNAYEDISRESQRAFEGYIVDTLEPEDPENLFPALTDASSVGDGTDISDWSSTFGDVSFSLETGITDGSTNAIRITGIKNSNVAASIPITGLEENTTYRISGSVYTDSAWSMRFRPDPNDTVGSDILLETGAVRSEWVQDSGEFTTNAGVTSTELQFFSVATNGSAYAIIDNLILEEVIPVEVPREFTPEEVYAIGRKINENEVVDLKLNKASNIYVNTAGTTLTSNNLELIIKILLAASGSSTAETTTYDNTDSGLTAENVKAALDEIVYLVGSSVSGINVVDTIADLRTLADVSKPALVLYHTNEANGGGGLFYPDAALVAGDENNGTRIFSSVATGGFRRFKKDVHKPADFGCLKGAGVDNSVALNIMGSDPDVSTVDIAPFDEYHANDAIAIVDKATNIHGYLVHSGAQRAGFTFVTHTIASSIRGKNQRIQVKSLAAQGAGWTGDGTYIGVKTGNDSGAWYHTEGNEFDVLHVAESDGTNTQGIQMCTFSQGSCLNNRVGFLARCVNTGWFNKNIIENGIWWHNSTVQLTTTRYGIIFGAGDGTYRQMNSNVVRGFDVELNGVALTGGAEAIPVLIEGAQSTHIYDMRYERNGNVAARITSFLIGSTEQNRYNVFECVYENMILDDQTQSKTNTIFRIDDSKAREYRVASFNALLDIDDSGADTIMLNRNFRFTNSNFSADRSATLTAAQKTSASITIVAENEGYTLTNTAVVLKVKSDVAKKFRVNMNKTGGRLSVRCFDAANTEINGTTNVADPSVVAVGNGTAPFTSLFSGVFRESAGDTSDLQLVTVGASVEYVEFIFGIGSSAISLRGISVDSFYEPALIV